MTHPPAEALAVVLAASCGTTTGFVLGEPTPGGLEAPEAGSAETSGEAGSMAVDPVGDAATGQQGGDGGRPFADLCPEGEAVIGYRGYLAVPPGLTIVGVIQTMCGSLSLNPSSPGQVTTTEGPVSPERGASQEGGAWMRTCPANEVVVGFVGRSGRYLDQVAFECAAWTLDPDAGGMFAMGTPATLEAAGGDGGSPYEASCPSGQLARGSFGRSGLWVDAFGLLCGTPTLSGDGGP